MRGGTTPDRNRLLARKLREEGYVKSPAIARAFEKVDRALFVPEGEKERAYYDTPLPIGHMQTISAPSMVAIMLEEMNLERGMKVLEIGAGSGYHAALTAEIVRPGKVYSIERIEALADMARKNLEAAGIDNIEVIVGDGSVGYPAEAPYHRIYITAASPNVPLWLLDQVVDGGIILSPVGKSRWWQDLVRVTKVEGSEPKIERLGGCVFVPLKGKKGFRV